MNRVVVDANVAFAVGSCEGSIRSSGNALNICFATLSDLRMVRRSSRTLEEMLGAIVSWCEVNRMSLRIMVNDRIVAEGGMKSDDGGLHIRWGRYWRVRPFDVLKLILKK